ncbi:MAG: type IX secretion system protein PorQ [Saprospiraceae bacterium]|nr:type IX secretion system protein PorQ [Saprospiraceae bacterium]MBK8853319.1 type IX secretion system protein PorQ [Saprospiraceae bacterium]
MKYFYSVFLLFLTTYSLSGQTGGNYTYQFLSLPNSARLSALGGSLITVCDDDVTLAYINPASLNPKTHGNISVSHQFHFADIQHTYAAYGHSFSKWKVNTHVGLHHFNYGDFKYGNEIGISEGNFSAGETALIIGASKSIKDKLMLGVNVKSIFSSFETYNSFGLATDIGAIYFIDSAYSSLGLVVRNLGGEISSFNAKNASAPLDIQLGYSKRLKYLPFRFSIILRQLQRWNIRYDDPEKEQSQSLFGEQEEESGLQKETDNLFRHFSFNGEFLLGKNQNFRIRGGYNHIQRKELSVESLRSLAGFSMGIGFKISYFKLDYAATFHHVAGATNHVTISTNLQKFKKL